MTYKILRRILNWSVGIFGCLFFLSGFFAFSAVSVLNYFREALGEVRKIEDKSLLNSLRASTPFIAKDAISFLGNSKNIEAYIRSVDKGCNRFSTVFLGFVLLFFLSLILRIWFRKSKFRNNDKVVLIQV
jgi:hypothetical protein